MARKRRARRKAPAPKVQTAEAPKDGGRLTKQVLRQKLRSGKGPVLNLGAGLSRKKPKGDFREGLR